MSHKSIGVLEHMTLSITRRYIGITADEIEQVENEVNGLLILPGDADAISEALRRLIHHPAEAQAFGQAARQTVLSHYSIDSVVERYAALYTSLVDPEDR